MSGNTLPRLNITSKEFVEGTDFTGTLVLPRNQKRGYFFVVVTSGTGDVAFGEDALGKVPLANLQHYEPYVSPTSKIHVTVTALGKVTIVTNSFK